MLISNVIIFTILWTLVQCRVIRTVPTSEPLKHSLERRIAVGTESSHSNLTGGVLTKIKLRETPIKSKKCLKWIQIKNNRFPWRCVKFGYDWRTIVQACVNLRISTLIFEKLKNLKISKKKKIVPWALMVLNKRPAKAVMTKTLSLIISSRCTLGPHQTKTKVPKSQHSLMGYLHTRK